MEPLIETYLTDVLYPKLKQYSITEDVINKVGTDIKSRIHSLLSHWNNTEFKRTLLVTGIEEAFFYQPPTQIEVRCLVVLTIRNSLFEDLSSTNEAAQSLGLDKTIIPEHDVRKFTSDAINYFSGIDLSECSGTLESGKDIYGSLKTLYPRAWNVLKELGDIVFRNKKYAVINHSNSRVHNVKLKSDNLINIDQYYKKKTVILSGMDPNIDPHLLNVLKSIQEGTPFFFTDSFKSITRNPDKLFKVIENVLARNASIVTCNFYLSQEYVSCRGNLLRPGHSRKDILENLNNRSGLTK
ncbi:hypothetical protein M3661_29435 [Paenibacillus sp. MER 180]|uniref:hypothetical protein n=1 Tax=Paenibacillus sp. MER 180 TaxID=2939570 RepID=UPI00203A756B|nr:hypothetical protein [Paenibacillus sp. MER 180]MCM3294212.1 hypothetical protein [Paenibacillus sp. MER 180]